MVFVVVFGGDECAGVGLCIPCVCGFCGGDGVGGGGLSFICCCVLRSCNMQYICMRMIISDMSLHVHSSLDS